VFPLYDEGLIPRRPDAGENGAAVSGVVYVVDDDASVRRSLRRLLLALDYTPQEFPNVDEFLKFLDHPLSALSGCVIADVTVPGRRGTELPGELRRRGLPMPVILVTAHDQNDVRSEAKRCGASAYLRKPVDEQALVDAIEWALSSGAGSPPARSP
jgi:FixJ family two-component response regulator